MTTTDLSMRKKIDAKKITTGINIANVQNIKAATCPSISGRGKISYEIGKTKEKADVVRILRSDLGGKCCSKWVLVSPLLQKLDAIGEKFFAGALMDTPLGKSNNNRGFLLAVLQAEGYVDLIPEQNGSFPRWFRMSEEARARI